MEKIFYVIVSLMMCSSMLSQDYKNYEWSEDPSSFMDSEFNAHDSFFVLKKENIQHWENNSNNIDQFNLTHHIYFLNSDESIERYNKVYIPIAPQRELMLNKARVISPSGKIQELDESKIIEATDDETGRRLRYFAFDGVEKGSYIEYLHVLKMSPQVYGRRIDFQQFIPVKKASFELKTLNKLIFKFKSFNGLNDVVYKEEENTGTYLLEVEDIPEMPRESLATPRAHLQYFIFALDKNNFNNTNNISGYNVVAKNIHNYLYQDFSKKQQKNLDKLSKSLNLNRLATTDEKVIAIENHIKRNYYLVNSGSSDLEDFDAILKTQVANGRGIMLLYTKLLEHNKIEATPVITSDRGELIFDPTFEAHNYLQDFLLLIEETGAYIAPEEANARYPYLPKEFADNYGLFLKKLRVGDFVSAASEIDFIKALEATKNIDKIRANVSFNEDDIKKLSIDYEKHWSGYNAMIFQPFIDLIDDDSKTEITKNLIESVTDDITILEWEIQNDDPALFSKAPLIFKYQLETDDLVNKAGENLIFQVGKLIGRQVEMYQEKKRVLPVEGQNNRIYDRVLRIQLPSAYEIQNIEDIVIKEVASINGEEVMLFHSYYTLENKILTVYADEFYKETIIPVEHFEDYRRVINSAADFNNVNLILKPTQ